MSSNEQVCKWFNLNITPEHQLLDIQLATKTLKKWFQDSTNKLLFQLCQINWVLITVKSNRRQLTLCSQIEDFKKIKTGLWTMEEITSQCTKWIWPHTQKLPKLFQKLNLTAVNKLLRRGLRTSMSPTISSPTATSTKQSIEKTAKITLTSKS